MAEKYIAMLVSLDTKAPEAQYLKTCIEHEGAHPLLVDIGYGQAAKIPADISADAVAHAAGSSIDAVYAMQGTSERAKLMMQGAIIKVQELIHQGRCDGVIAFGGASNTTLATSVMDALPVGTPKLMISSAAAVPAYAAMYFGSNDITIMHSLVDISSLNDLSRAFLKNGAGAICGMARTSSGPMDTLNNRNMIAVTSFRFAEVCSQAVMRELEKLGYTAIPFHAQGIGEDAMETLLAQGIFEGVIDIVPAGLSEYLLGGNRAARPERLEAAGKAGIPQVITPSGFDMISCGPIARKDNGDALWESKNFAARQISLPDHYRVEVRTTVEEVAEIAQSVARKLNQAQAAVSILVPVKGWSSLSVEGTELYNPDADAAFVPALKQNLKPSVAVIEIPAELNSKPFAKALVDELHGMIEAKKSSTSE